MAAASLSISSSTGRTASRSAPASPCCRALRFSARAPLTAKIAIGTPTQGTGRDALVVSSQNDFAELGTTGKASFPSETDISASVAALMEPDPVVTASVSDTSTGNETADLLQAFHNSTAPGEGDLSFGSRAQLWLSAATKNFGRWLNYQGTTPRALRRMAPARW
jgi:hypothetical protein